MIVCIAYTLRNHYDADGELGLLVSKVNIHPSWVQNTK